MTNILLVGVNNAILSALKEELMECYTISQSEPPYKEVLSAIKTYNPDLVLMYQTHSGELEQYMFRTVRNDYPDLPVLAVCSEKDYFYFKPVSPEPQFTFLYRPVGSPTIISEIDRILHLSDSASSDNASANNYSSLTSDELDFKILAVDDNPMVLRNIKNILGDEYKVLYAPSGEKALEIIEKNKVDLILLDYEMPGKNGAEMIKTLRLFPRTKNVPVIFLTGVSDRNKISQILQYKPQAYLLKPINPDTLRSTIQEALWKLSMF